LGDKDQEIDGQHDQNSEKTFVIFASHTVIQVFTVMIEAICTSVTSHTVVAIFVDILVAQNTLFKFVYRNSALGLLAGYQGIYRVGHREIEIVVDYYNEQHIVERQEEYKDGVPDYFNYWWHYEDGMQHQNY
jgi:hypothetical protein